MNCDDDSKWIFVQDRGLDGSLNGNHGTEIFPEFCHWESSSVPVFPDFAVGGHAGFGASTRSLPFRTPTNTLSNILKQFGKKDHRRPKSIQVAISPK